MNYSRELMDYKIFINTKLSRGNRIFNSKTGEYYLSISQVVKETGQTKEYINKNLDKIQDDSISEWISLEKFFTLPKEDKEKILDLNSSSKNNEPFKYKFFILKERSIN